MCLDHFMKEIYTTYYPNANALTFAKLAKVYANFDETSLEEHFNKFMYSEQLMISEQEILT
jgi:predicted metalloprotease with PDZ domain